MKYFSSLALAAAVAASAFAAAPASAITVTYANFAQSTNAKQFRYFNTGTSNRLYTTTSATSTDAGGVAVDFKYLVSVPAALQGFQDAILTLDASSTQMVSLNGDNASQGGFSGKLSIRRAVPLDGKDNLLTIDFTNGTFFSVLGGSSATYTISIPGAGTNIKQESDFLMFGNVVEADFSLSFSALSSTFAKNGGGYGRSFRANATGTFASNPAPTGVPEPEMWGLMILGFGMVGVAVRRRRSVTRVAA